MTSRSFKRAVGGALIILGVLAVPFTALSAGQQVVRLRDDCDPATFNAALQDPNAGVGNGDTTFDKFLAELQKGHQAGAWRFNPDHFTVDAGQDIVAHNTGGETHTFTKVEQFGDGFVGFLNEFTEDTDLAMGTRASMS